MADIINLRQARKQRARADKVRMADANRAKFGRTKSERQLSAQEQDRRERALEALRREPSDPNDN